MTPSCVQTTGPWISKTRPKCRALSHMRTKGSYEDETIPDSEDGDEDEDDMDKS